MVFAGTTAAAAATAASGNALTFGGYDQVRVGVFSNTVEHTTRGVRMTSNELTNNGHTAVNFILYVKQQLIVMRRR